MTTINRLQLVLENAARVSCRYGLLTERDFVWVLFPIPKQWSSSAFAKARNRIKGTDRIEDCKQDLHIDRGHFYELERSTPEEPGAILEILDSSCDLPSMRWQEELATRRYRNRLAWKYICTSIDETHGLYAQHQKEIAEHKEAAEKREKRFRKVLFLCLCIAIAVYQFGPSVVDGLTPVEVLTRKIYEDSRFRYDGSICRDGWISGSQGRGTCSHHGGVSREFYKGEYRMTIEQARVLATERSWLQ